MYHTRSAAIRARRAAPSPKLGTAASSRSTTRGSTAMSLSSLPLDVLLQIFRLLSTRDVIRLRMMSKSLCTATHERYVWLDQVRNHCRENPSLRLSPSSIKSLSTEDLYHRAVRHEKLRIRWDQPPNPDISFAHTALTGRGTSCLLPGGDTILWIPDRSGDIALYRAFPSVNSQSGDPPIRYIEGMRRWTMKKPIQTTTPHPVLVCTKGSSVKLLVVDEARGATNTVVSLTIRGDVTFDHFRGQERVVCFLVHGMGPRGEGHIVAVHLDYPTTTLHMDVPSAASININKLDICLPHPDLLVVIDQDEINTYRLPDFSTLGPGDHIFEQGSICCIKNPFGDVNHDLFKRIVHIVEQVYDPLLAPAFNLHFEDLTEGVVFTFRIDPSSPMPRDDFVIHTSESTFTKIREGPVIWATLLDETGPEERRRFLKFYAPREVFSYDGSGFAVVHVDVDEFSGRVLVARYDGYTRTKDLFVAELGL